jgi:NAD(P)-dependent dehydrogenase (short-subunit alcohol dehydrogenase family)
MDLQIEGLRVLVTAGAAGIGLETVRAFLREGAKVHVCDVDGASLAALRQSHPEVTTSNTDVSDRRAVATLFDDALAALGGLDCLVNNAGIAGPTGRVDEIDPGEWDRTLAVDITGTFNCTRVAVQHIRQSRNGSSSTCPLRRGSSGFRCGRPTRRRNGGWSASPRPGPWNSASSASG